MGSFIKINPISIDPESAADEIDAGKCEHFSIRGFVAEIRERDHRKCWPFSAETADLEDHQSYSLPSLSVLKSRWWRCPSCIRDIELDAGSSDITSKRNQNSLVVIDKKEKKNDDQTEVTLLKKVRHRAKEASTVKSKSSKLASPEQVSKRSREKANISTEISWKERLEAVNGGETMEASIAFWSSEIAGVVDDTPNKAIKKNDRYDHVLAEQDECDNVSSETRNLVGPNPDCMTELHRRKTRKVRLLSELLSKNKETLSEGESVRGRKRKSSGDEDCRPSEITNYACKTTGKTSENASKSCDSEDNTGSSAESRPNLESQSTDKDLITGKQRNRRFKVVEDRFPETLQNDTYDYASSVHSSFPGKELVHTQRTEKEDDPALLKDIGTNYFRDECLRTGVNVNFCSNRNTTRSSSLNDKLRHTSSTEVADSSCALQKGKGKEVVVQELSGAHRIHSKITEHIDDFPMEIVELMAKNQYERCLPDREEDKEPSKPMASVSKNALLIDLNETYDNSMDENTLRQPKPLGMNARNGDGATKDGQFMTGKQNSLEFSLTSQFGQPYNVPFGFGISPLTRDNQSSSIQFSGVVGLNWQRSHNYQSVGNVPTTISNHQNPSPSSFRVSRVCNTCQSVQQQQYREASHPIWPSFMTSSHVHKPVSLNMPQNFMDRSTKLDYPNMLNLNLVNKPVHQSKEFIGPQPGDCNKTAYFTKQRPLDFYSKRVTSRENFAIIPAVGTSSFSFQSEKRSAENADFTFQPSWNHHQKKNSKRKDIAPIYNNSNHQKTNFRTSSSNPGKFQLLGASDSMILPLKSHITDNAKKHKTEKPQSYNAVSAWPPTSTSASFVCSFNRNPADFTIPYASGNLYMIKGEDLKVRKQAGVRKNKACVRKMD